MLKSLSLQNAAPCRGTQSGVYSKIWLPFEVGIILPEISSLHRCVYWRVPLYWSNWWSSDGLAWLSVKKKKPRLVLWECFVMDFLCLWGVGRHLWCTSMIRLPMSVWGLDLHVAKTSTCLSESQEYLFWICPTLLWSASEFLLCAKGQLIGTFWFSLVQERIFWFGALGLWCVSRKSAKRNRKAWSWHDACLVSHTAKLLFATCLLVESSPHSLHPAFIKWRLHDTSGVFVFWLVNPCHTHGLHLHLCISDYSPVRPVILTER